MRDKKEILDIFKVGIVLFLITGASAFVLALVNSITAPIITQNDAKTQLAAMQKVLYADDFKEVNFENDIVSSVTEIYEAGDKGYVVKTAPNGYGGKISMIIGIDKELKVSGVEIISQSETAGLGANCTRDEFKTQFVGKTENIKVVKSGAKENEIDAITSATITSKATAKGVNDAIAAVKNLKEGE